MPATAVSPLEIARRENGLTQRDLAARAGVTAATVSRAERGRALTLTSALALASALGADLSALFDHETSEAPADIPGLRQGTAAGIGRHDASG